MSRILDWEQYLEIAKEVVAEGQILLKNDGDVLPLKEGQTVSIFGRIQTKYYKSGTGSGGMVNVSKVINIPEGLREGGRVKLNEDLYKLYETWEETNPFDEGHGWGTEPWSQVEMPMTKEIVDEASKKSDLAIVIIGRTAGEDKDACDVEGAYRLSLEERNMLELVRAGFDKVVVLLNVGGLMDVSFIDEYHPEAVMIVWQGGMVGGDGTARVLDGRECPSGRLTDTVAYKIEDYPSHPYFGDKVRNFYGEDIFVGYRYFETFAQDKVRYPFGYGLSYTSFELECVEACDDRAAEQTTVKLKVTNTGEVTGKDAVQVYVKAPSGKLGKAARVLTAIGKTSKLSPGESEIVTLVSDYREMASFDDLGATGHEYAWVMEAGEYELYAGENVREAKKVFSFDVPEDIVIEQLESALGPVISFDRMKEENGKVVFENVPVTKIDERERRLERLPEDIKQNFTTNYKLDDVLEGRVPMKDFIAQFTDDDLECIVRGEGMGSSLVTPGTASAFGGVSEHLREMGIPCVCCDDGPSGMRLDSGVKAFSLPNGTLIASTFNTSLICKMYSYLSLEMTKNKVECLLGPGMNIHRHPLNGRNFEYFSEDPYLTGLMGQAELEGLSSNALTYGTAKHFCGNNQEEARTKYDSVISERALREIYLKGFEMVVRSGACKSVMTTYNAVNGLWTAGSYDLNTTILRKQWGFRGIVMTDWWAAINERDGEPTRDNFAQMVRSQNDLFMVVPVASKNGHGDNIASSLAEGTLTRGELQECAANICEFAMNTEAFLRERGKQEPVEVIGKENEAELMDAENLEYISFYDETTIPLNYKPSKAGTDYTIPLDILHIGNYQISVTSKCNLSEVSQSACTLYYTGVPFLTYTFSGTNGKAVTIDKELYLHNRMGVFRLNVPKDGLEIESITFKRLPDPENEDDRGAGHGF